MEKAVIGAGSPVAEGRGPAGPVAVAEEEEENLGIGGCEGAESDAGRFWARDRFFYRAAERAVKHCRSSRTIFREKLSQKVSVTCKKGKQHKRQPNNQKHKTNPHQPKPRQVPEKCETREPQVKR